MPRASAVARVHRELKERFLVRFGFRFVNPEFENFSRVATPGSLILVVYRMSPLQETVKNAL